MKLKLNNEIEVRIVDDKEIQDGNRTYHYVSNISYIKHFNIKKKKIVNYILKKINQTIINFGIITKKH